MKRFFLLLLTAITSCYSQSITLRTSDNKLLTLDTRILQYSTTLYNCCNDTNDQTVVTVPFRKKTIERIFRYAKTVASAKTHLKQLAAMDAIEKKVQHKKNFSSEINAADYFEIPLVLKALLRSLAIQLQRHKQQSSPSRIGKFFTYLQRRPNPKKTHSVLPAEVRYLLRPYQALLEKDGEEKQTLMRQSSIADLLEAGIKITPNKNGHLKVDVRDLYGLELLAQQLNPRTIRSISLMGSAIDHINREDFARLSHVNSINLCSSKLRAVEPGTFVHLKRLQSLDLHATPVSHNERELDQIFQDVGTHKHYAMIRI